MNAQLEGLAIAYAITAAAMLLGMWVMRADKRGYLRWPVYSAMVMFLAVWTWNALRRNVMPPEWGLTRPALLYYGAMAVYAVFGLGIGLIVGRVTRPRGELTKEIETSRGSEDDSK
jgi:O-antigen/teichoic acid export membrane protein